MGGGSGNKGYKGDDAENMCGTTLEPDPRYQGCCSNIFRPGKVLRDVLIGFLVVLAIAVVIAVLFVVCFYLLPDTESSLAVEESAFVGKPIEKETNFNDLNEVELTDDTRYDVRPDVILGSIQNIEGQMEPEPETMDHEEHHHVGPTPVLDIGAEPEAKAEPEPKSEPEPEPEGADHDHMHMEDKMTHEHMPKEDGMPIEFMPKEEEMPHEHMHKEGEMTHDHIHTEGEMPHEHMQTDGGMNQDHMHKEMTDEHSHMEGEHDHEHMMGPENEGPGFAPSAPANDKVIEVVGAPALETTPTEHTVFSVSSAFSPGATIQIQPSESEGATASVSESLSPLNEILGPHFNETAALPGFEVFPEDGTEVPEETQPEGEAIDFVVPVAIEEVVAPVLIADDNSTTEVVPAGTCRPRKLEMCSDLPYGLTALPNWANDQNEEELNEGSLPFFRDVIVRSGCSPRARQYACGVLEPPCNSDGSIVPPCRTFCRSVAATCQEFIISGYSLSDVFDCEKFPDSADPSVCFDMTQDFSPVASSTNATLDAETQTIFPGQLDGAVTTLPEEAIEDATTDPLVEDTTLTSSGCPELQCLDGTCLALSQLNDGVNDCPDGTDEQDFGPLF